MKMREGERERITEKRGKEREKTDREKNDK